MTDEVEVKVFDRSDYHSAEDAIAERIAAFWKATAFRLPRFYALTHALVEDKKPICFLDVRIRQFHCAQHPSVMLPLSKVLRGIELQNMTGIPFVLAIKFSDALTFCRPADMALETFTNVRIDGRNRQQKSGQMQEIEPQVMIAISALTGIQEAHDTNSPNN
jgi:hypothetical protein